MQSGRGLAMETDLPDCKSRHTESQTSPMLKSKEAQAGEDGRSGDTRWSLGCQACSRSRILKTTGCYGSFFVSGLLVSLIATFVVELEEITQSSTVQMALLFTWLHVGRLPAVLLCGLSFDRFNKDLQLGFGVLILAVSGAVIPICTNYYTLATSVGLAGAAIGFIGSGCTTVIINLWSNAAFLQGLHLSLSIGSMIGPLLGEAFLGKKTETPTNTTSNAPDIVATHLLGYTSNQSSHFSNLSMESYDYLVTNLTSHQGSTLKSITSFQLIGPFIIYTVISLFIVTVFLALWFESVHKDTQKMPLSKKEEEEEEMGSDYDSEKESSKLTQVFLAFVFLLLFSLGAFEATYGGLIVQYSYKFLKLSKASSKMVSASYWGGMTSGRVVGLFISSLGHLSIQIAIYLTIGITAMAILSSLATLHYSVVWIASIMAGLTISTTIGNIFMMAKKEFQLTSRSTSLLMFGLFVGMMLGPAGTSQCIEWFGVAIFPHVNLGFTLIMGASFAIILFLKRMIKLQSRKVKEGEYLGNVYKTKPLLQVGNSQGKKQTITTV